MQKEMDGQVSLFDLASSYGKTSPGHSAPTREKISAPCWKNWPVSANQTLLFLDLTAGEDGPKRGLLPETDGASLGGRWTLNIGESPSDAKESRLSWILEASVPEKYYLSARACRGILNRTSRRGRELPAILKTALLEMIAWQDST